MAKETSRRLAAANRDDIVSGANERQSTRSRRRNAPGQTPRRSPYRRGGLRTTPDRASIVPSGSRLNANRISPHRQTRQAVHNTRRTVSFDPDLDLADYGLASRPSTIRPRNATPERDVESDENLTDEADSPERPTQDVALVPLGRGPRIPTPAYARSFSRESDNAAPTSPPNCTLILPTYGPSPTLPAYPPTSPPPAAPMLSPNYASTSLPTAGLMLSPSYAPTSPPAHPPRSPTGGPVYSPVNRNRPYYGQTTPVPNTRRAHSSSSSRARRQYTPTSPQYPRLTPPRPPPASSSSPVASPTSPNWDAPGPPGEDSESQPDDEELYDEDDPCRDVFIERDNLRGERDNLREKRNNIVAQRDGVLAQREQLFRERRDNHAEIDQARREERYLHGLLREENRNLRNLCNERDDPNDTCREIREERDELLAQRDRDIAERDRVFVGRFDLIADLNRTIGERDHLRRRLQREQEANRDLRNLRNDPDDPCRDIRRERDDALAEIERLQTEIQTNIDEANDFVGQLDDEFQDLLDVSNREIIRLGGVVPEYPVRQGPPSPREDSLEDYESDDDDPCRQIREERDNALRERELILTDAGNLNLQVLELQVENGRLQDVVDGLQREYGNDHDDDPCREVRRERDAAVAEGERLSDSLDRARVDIHRLHRKLAEALARRNTPQRRDPPHPAEPRNPRRGPGDSPTPSEDRQRRQRPAGPRPRPVRPTPGNDAPAAPPAPATPIPTGTTRTVIAVVPSPLSQELQTLFPNQGASGPIAAPTVRPAPTGRPATRGAAPALAASTRTTRTQVAGGEAAPPPDPLISPRTRARKEAAKKPAGVSKPTKKGKGRKK
jgi:hypothetical protein